MKKKRPKRDAKKRQDKQKWEKEKATMEDFHKKAPYMKLLLRSRGCDLPFYDFLDSYETEFSRLVDEFENKHESLIGIFEVDSTGLDSTDWEQFGGKSDWQQVFYNCDDKLADTYGKGDKKANVNSNTVTLEDSSGNYHALVRLHRQIKCNFQHKENKYAIKIPALLHEIGHVIDIEKQINFDPVNKRCNIIDAEVFANHYAFAECHKRGYRQSLETFRSSYEQYIGGNDYRAEVAKRSLEDSPTEADMIVWFDLLDQEITQEEVKLIGQKGIDALGGS